MRALPLLLFLVAAPALAQQGPVDPDLVGTWVFEFIEAPDLPEDIQIESMTVTFTADGRLLASGTASRGGERQSMNEEETFWTEGGEIHASNGPPARYEIVGTDGLRISIGPDAAVRFRRLSN